jgi:diguanylate cyclase (GGDEF)-like protein/PAS domain S-box-containing protein
MESAIHTKRKIDALISIRQDNVAREIIIINMNEAAQRLVGYNAKEVSGKILSTILAPRVNEILESYLDFENNSSDFAIVARKIPNFQILSKKGEIISASLKVFNLVGQGGDIQEYELLMRDITLINKIAELKEIITNNSDKIKDKDAKTGLPNINNVVYATDTAYSFLEQHSSIDVCFAMVEMRSFEYYKQNYGEYIACEIAGKVGDIIKKCLRTEDVLGYMGTGIIALVLIDCSLESAQNVFGRIQKDIASAQITLKNGKAVSLPIAAAYTQIRKDRDMALMINACEDGLDSITSRGGEGFIEV